jgi:hypothetical protein
MKNNRFQQQDKPQATDLPFVTEQPGATPARQSNPSEEHNFRALLQSRLPKLKASSDLWQRIRSDVYKKG